MFLVPECANGCGLPGDAYNQLQSARSQSLADRSFCGVAYDIVATCSAPAVRQRSPLRGGCTTGSCCFPRHGAHSPHKPLQFQGHAW